MEMVELNRGASPLILAFPHTGTHVPEDIWAKLNDEGRKLRDTDWHVHELYQGLMPDVTTVRTTCHRYCLDANRDPTGRSLYPGQNTTGLIPLTDFDDQPLWIEGREPDATETSERVLRFHEPYHRVLQAEIERVRARHGVAVLYDCHSIRSVCPFLFEGRLPDFSIGTDGGRTCDPLMEQEVSAICRAAEGYTAVTNGRFRGGWTTRHYGQPEAGVHAIQMELTQATHLKSETPPFDQDVEKSARLREVLQQILQRIEALAYQLARKGR
ncbi:N-formylglutamate deformylase [Mesorhizobium sp. KR9-304]|uniref:N-formylglutamate deformylase n=1 Tax=Mesorhizobium sp. KR9-304 TaxID=3156614 RepID=UPI0032B3E875